MKIDLFFYSLNQIIQTDIFSFRTIFLKHTSFKKIVQNEKMFLFSIYGMSIYLYKF